MRHLLFVIQFIWTGLYDQFIQFLDLIFYRLGYVPRWELQDCRDWANYYANRWTEAENESANPTRGHCLSV